MPRNIILSGSRVSSIGLGAPRITLAMALLNISRSRCNLLANCGEGSWCSHKHRKFAVFIGYILWLWLLKMRVGIGNGGAYWLQTDSRLRCCADCSGPEWAGPRLGRALSAQGGTALPGGFC